VFAHCDEFYGFEKSVIHERFALWYTHSGFGSLLLNLSIVLAYPERRNDDIGQQ